VETERARPVKLEVIETEGQKVVLDPMQVVQAEQSSETFLQRFINQDPVIRAAKAMVPARTAIAMMMPLNSNPRKAIRMAPILDRFLLGRRSPYPTVVAVMNDQ